MKFEDLVMAAITSKRNEEEKVKPVAFLKDHFDLQRSHDIYIETLEAMTEEAKILERKAEAYKKAYFKSLCEKLIEKGLCTRSEIDKCEGQRIKDGVIFLYVGEDE